MCGPHSFLMRDLGFLEALGFAVFPRGVSCHHGPGPSPVTVRSPGPPLWSWCKGWRQQGAPLLQVGWMPPCPGRRPPTPAEGGWFQESHPSCSPLPPGLCVGEAPPKQAQLRPAQVTALGAGQAGGKQALGRGGCCPCPWDGVWRGGLCWAASTRGVKCGVWAGSPGTELWCGVEV